MSQKSPDQMKMNRTQVVPVTTAVPLNNDFTLNQPSRKKRVSRSGTIAIDRLKADMQAQTDSNNKKKNQLGKATSQYDLNGDGHLDMNERIAMTLSKSKSKGIVSSRSLAGMAAFKKGNLLDDPHSVIHQSLKIQAEFRLKIQFAFIAQLCVMYAVMLFCLYTPFISELRMSIVFV